MEVNDAETAQAEMLRHVRAVAIYTRGQFWLHTAVVVVLVVLYLRTA